MHCDKNEQRTFMSTAVPKLAGPKALASFNHEDNEFGVAVGRRYSHVARASFGNYQSRPSQRTPKPERAWIAIRRKDRALP